MPTWHYATHAADEPLSVAGRPPCSLCHRVRHRRAATLSASFRARNQLDGRRSHLYLIAAAPPGRRRCGRSTKYRVDSETSAKGHSCFSRLWSASYSITDTRRILTTIMTCYSLLMVTNMELRAGAVALRGEGCNVYCLPGRQR